MEPRDPFVEVGQKSKVVTAIIILEVVIITMFFLLLWLKG
jgi:hypothetical protein